MQYLFSRLLLPSGVLLLLGLSWDRCAAQQYPDSGVGPRIASEATVNTLNRSVVPGPPRQPAAASRPAAWPSGVTNDSSPWTPPEQRLQASEGNGLPPQDHLQPCEGSRIIARVGTEVILESDLVVRSMRDLEVIGGVREVIEANKDRIPPGELDVQRELLIKKILPSLIQTKLVYLDAKRAIPPEGWAQVERHINGVFDDTVLEKMMKRAGAGSARELDQKFRAMGTSLDRERRAYLEFEVARQYVHQQTKRDDEITYDHMVTYYRQNQGEFTAPARVRWEELLVRYAKHPDKAAAYDAIARLGNHVAAGSPFGKVAKAASDGVTAPEGGQRPWTNQGALVCKELDQALFQLPLGQLSPIIEGPTGFHIIRVTDREPSRVTPFLEAQTDIREKIVRQRTEKQMQEYLAKIESKTPVWTIFDNPHGSPQSARRLESSSLR